MGKKEVLEKCLKDYDRHSCVEIHLVWSDGTKAGIRNRDAINAAMTALKEELKRQLEELK